MPTDIEKLWNDAFVVMVEEGQLQSAFQLTDSEYNAMELHMNELARAMIAAQEVLKDNNRAAAFGVLAVLHEKINYLINYLMGVRNGDTAD